MKKTIICIIMFLIIGICSISNVLADTTTNEIQRGYGIKTYISHTLENKWSMFGNDLRYSGFFNSNKPPQAPFIYGPTQGIINVQYIFSINSTITPELDSVYYKWDWGDGNITNWGPFVSGQPSKANHMWTQKGVYEIRVKINYTNGEESGWSEPYRITIIEKGFPTHPLINGPKNVKVGIKYEYMFCSTDLYTDELTYIINWGDGTQSEITGLSSSETLTNHTWCDKGIYIIKAKAKNIWGVESDWGKLIVIMPRTRVVSIPFLRFLQQHLNMFPFLQKLLNRLGQ